MPTCRQAVDSLPLTALFIDCDSFFASCEQLFDPSLRGSPVGVAPVMAESSCCIAASYEARKHGVRTGTGIAEARRLCPGIRIVEARPTEYVRIHHRIIEAVEDCIHVEAVLSIDEMWCWLPLNWRSPAFVTDLGRRIKATIAERIGPAVTVSIGAAPNRYLAKVASKLNKPDGFGLLEHGDLPEALHGLELSDLTGIGRSMEARLHAAGIHSVAALCSAPRTVLRGVWGGVEGDRLWHLLRGVVLPEPETVRRSISHSHVLPPAERTPARAWPVLCKLLHKVCERLRSHGMLAGSLALQIAYLGGPSWSPEIRFAETDSTLCLMRRLQGLWRDRPDPQARLLQAGVALGHLMESRHHTPDLFETQAVGGRTGRHARLDEAVDQLRARYGRQCVYYASAHEARGSAPMRIAFHHVPDLDLESDG